MQLSASPARPLSISDPFMHAGTSISIVSSQKTLLYYIFLEWSKWSYWDTVRIKTIKCGYFILKFILLCFDRSENCMWVLKSYRGHIFFSVRDRSSVTSSKDSRLWWFFYSFFNNEKKKENKNVLTFITSNKSKFLEEYLQNMFSVNILRLQHLRNGLANFV